MKLALSSEAKWKLAALCLAVFAVIVRYLVWRGSGFRGEDAYITMRYAENLAQGHGYVFNLGERIQGTTTPLDTLVVALGVALGFDAMTFSRTLGILADGATTFLIARWLAHPSYNARWAGLWAALLWALDRASHEVAVSGMETPLVTLAGVAALWAVMTRRTSLAAFCGAALLLLRIDTLPLVLILCFLAFCRNLPIARRDVALFLLPPLFWTLFAWIYFGSPIPNSLRAKLWAYPPSWNASLSGFDNQFGGPIGKLTVLTCLCGALLFGGQFIQDRKNSAPRQFWSDDRFVLLAAFVWMVLYYGALIAGRRPVFYWYLLPPRPVYWMMVVWPFVLAMRWIGASLSIAPRLKNSIGASLLFLAAVGVGRWQISRVIPILEVQQRVYDAVIPPASDFLAHNVAPNERVMLEPIGYIGYFSKCRLLDLVGMVSPEVEPSYRTQTPLSDMITRLKPEWLCLRPGEVDRVRSQNPSLPQSQYDLVKTFSFQSQPVYLVFRRKPRMSASLQ